MNKEHDDELAKILLSNHKLLAKTRKYFDEADLDDPKGGKYDWWWLCMSTMEDSCADVNDGAYPVKVPHCRSFEGVSRKRVKIRAGVIDFKSLFRAIDEVAFDNGWGKDSGPPDHHFLESISPEATHLDLHFGS